MLENIDQSMQEHDRSRYPRCIASLPIRVAVIGYTVPAADDKTFGVAGRQIDNVLHYTGVSGSQAEWPVS